MSLAGTVASTSVERAEYAAIRAASARVQMGTSRNSAGRPTKRVDLLFLDDSLYRRLEDVRTIGESVLIE